MLRSVRPIPSGVPQPFSFGCQCILAAADHSFCGAPQTAKHAPAKGATKDEFIHLFEKVKAKVEEARRKNPELFKVAPKYSFDMGSWHHVQAGELGLSERDMIKAPPLAPDFQKVVEHQHKAVKCSFKRKFNDDPRLQEGSPATVRAFKRVARKAVQQKKVELDARSLPATYKSILARKGNYAAGPRRSHKR